MSRAVSRNTLAGGGSGLVSGEAQQRDITIVVREVVMDPGKVS